MGKYFSDYCALISSPEQLALCRQAQSLRELLACIRDLWDCHCLSDDELLGDISRLNQIPISSPEVSLVGNWMPYHYQPKGQRVSWLVPVGHATEPFQDETISRYRQLLLNQIIQPCTTLAVAREAMAGSAHPAGFIFHLSRCGSTLVSGCLSELDSTCVFSEPPLLTALLSDKQLTPDEKKVSLGALINLQAAAFPLRPQMIIKWNAWDIFYWSLIRDLYPQVPVIFLVRDPIEILASHHKNPGRHMVGDILLTRAHPQWQVQDPDAPILERRIHVLKTLLEEMSAVVPMGLAVDYRLLDSQRIRNLCGFLCGDLNELALARVGNRLGFHSKYTGQLFEADTVNKQQLFSAGEVALIKRCLGNTYNRLLKIAMKVDAEVINA